MLLAIWASKVLSEALTAVLMRFEEISSLHYNLVLFEAQLT